MDFQKCDSISGNQALFPQSRNRPQRFSLSFLSVTRFSEFWDKIKYDKNKDKKFYRTGEISLKKVSFFDSIAKSHI